MRKTILTKDVNKIPTTGPLMIVANHPFGGLEAIVLGRLLFKIRTDVKFLGNYLLQRIPEMAPHIIPVDPFGRVSSISANSRAMMAAVRWILKGNALVVFSATAHSPKSSVL